MATETDEIHLNTVKVGAKGGGCVERDSQLNTIIFEVTYDFLIQCSSGQAE